MQKRNLTIFLLCLLLISTIVIAGDSDTGRTPDPLLNTTSSRTPMLISDVGAAEQEVINRTNQLRASLGLGPVTAKFCLSLAARRHSQDMGDRNYFDHDAPEPAPYGVTPWERMANAGYMGSPHGENIAAGYSSAFAAFEGWRNSPGHYVNMTDPNANEIGVGYAYVGNSDWGNYWTMVTGQTDGSETCPTNHPATSLDITGNLDTHPARPTFTWTHNTDTSDPSLIVPTQYRILIHKPNTTYMNVLVDVANPAVCVGTSCTYTPTDVDLPNGLKDQAYNLWIGSLSPSAKVKWAGPQSFTIAAGPGVTSIISPTEGATVGTISVVLTWAEDPKATHYRVYVANAAGKIYDEWHTSAAVCTTDCSISIDPGKDGPYRWWVATWGPSSLGPNWTGFNNFTLAAGPGVTTIISPTEGDPVTIPSVDLTWAKEPKATYYRIYVNGPNGKVYDKWWKSEDVCPADCGIPFAPNANGAHQWWVATWGPTSNGPNWTAANNFTVNVVVPSVVTGLDYSEANKPAQVISWNDGGDASFYHLVIMRVSDGVVVHRQWYSAAPLGICGGGVCKVESVDLKNDTYKFWVAGWAVGQKGAYTNPPHEESVSFGQPSLIANRQPADNSPNLNPAVTLRWDKDDWTTWYYISLTYPGGTALQGWFPARDICNDVYYCYSDSLNLSPGATYTWEMKSWGPGSIGSALVSPTTSFTVAN